MLRRLWYKLKGLCPFLVITFIAYSVWKNEAQQIVQFVKDFLPFLIL